MEKAKKKVTNQIMLITYADSMGMNLKELEEVLDKSIGKAIGGLHILPFFPSSADRGGVHRPSGIQ